MSKYTRKAHIMIHYLNKKYLFIGQLVGLRATTLHVFFSSGLEVSIPVWVPAQGKARSTRISLERPKSEFLSHY